MHFVFYIKIHFKWSAHCIVNEKKANSHFFGIYLYESREQMNKFLCKRIFVRVKKITDRRCKGVEEKNFPQIIESYHVYAEYSEQKNRTIGIHKTVSQEWRTKESERERKKKNDWLETTMIVYRGVRAKIA